MQVSAKIDGLEDALKAMAAAFPADPKKQRSLVNSAMRTAAKKEMLPTAKQKAKVGDGSGALSEALAIRVQPKKKTSAKGVGAGVEILPLRSNRKALAMYINHYYTQNGLKPPAGILVSGIRHGHLVEFGSVNNNATPFLWPAATAGKGAYTNMVGDELKKAVDKAVNKARKK
jgi:HK97 gp10 family phage protein